MMCPLMPTIIQRKIALNGDFGDSLVFTFSN